MSAGSYNRYAVIEEPTESTEAGFIEEDPWSSFSEVHGKLKWPRGQELILSDRPVAVKMGIFEIPWLEGVTEKMRIKMSDDDVTRYFQIAYVRDPDERKRRTEIGVIEVPKEHFSR